MSIRGRAVRPLARTEGLVVRQLEGEVLVYDLERHKAHCLGPLMAAVWHTCDGRSDVESIARRAARASGSPLDASLAALALHRLGCAHLLNAPATFLPHTGRRAVLSAAAALGGLTLMSIVAPHAAQAATCIPSQACIALGNRACTGQPCCESPSLRCRKPGNANNCSCV